MNEGDRMPKKTPARAALRQTPLAAIDSTRDELGALLSDLVRFRTESQTSRAEHFPTEARRCMTFLRDFLTNLGFSIDTWEVGPSATFEAHPVLVATLAGTGGGRSLAFNGHVDVVPVGDSTKWSHPAFEGLRSNGQIYGRGAVDMKGGIAAALWATKAALETGFSPRGDVAFHIVSDEEVVGNGSREIAAKMQNLDAVISVEPTDLQICNTEGGLVHFRLEVDGIEAHASNRYLSIHAGGQSGGGVNAIEKGLKLVQALQELERAWGNHKSHPDFPPGFSTFCPGLFVGGPGGGSDGGLNVITNPGTTPNYASIEYNLWFYPTDTLQQVKKEIEDYIEDVCRADDWLRDHPPTFTWKLRNIYFPPVNINADEPIVKIMSECLMALDLRALPRSFGAATDLAWYCERGIPGVIFGPGKLNQAHADNEHIALDDLVCSARVYASVLETWTG
jgi:acetylornithine deacetylase